MDTTIIRTDAEIRNFLYTKSQGDDIAAEVAQEALSHSYEDLSGFFHDLMQHGCVSGWISGLVWYSDTHAFFDKHYDEIEDIRVQLTEEGIAPQVNGDLKNFYAWFAFEEVAYQMAQELGLE